MIDIYLKPRVVTEQEVSYEAFTHLPLDKMATTFTDNIFKYIFMDEKCISIRISLKFVSKGPIDNKAALVQVIMAWHQKGDKPLPDLMLTQFNDTYMGL